MRSPKRRDIDKLVLALKTSKMRRIVHVDTSSGSMSVFRPLVDERVEIQLRVPKHGAGPVKLRFTFTESKQAFTTYREVAEVVLAHDQDLQDEIDWEKTAPKARAAG
ncbi:hypothetical protein K32_24470 [Kaistia sp. 32K]|uniref:hypothetical protein n=1 Tax=Kaistia sp. 32K TaxID=2795690 RepID=UPI001915D90B|nr:hypothetical protein [Kaistia sp. 32K]BCP53830.1 hypothetical protein K32_24470 [Kaistia sp. 32K]